MKSLTILLAVTLVAFAAPAAGAEGSCAPTPTTSYIHKPLENGKYIFLDPTELNKLGEWLESNAKSGLQTETCYDTGGFPIWRADKHSGALLP